MHSDEKPYTCSTCNKGFIRRHDMYQHAKIHGTDRLSCDKCPLKFVTPEGLRKHRAKIKKTKNTTHIELTDKDKLDCPQTHSHI